MASLTQAPAGQLQEDVLEGCPAHVHLAVLEARAFDRRKEAGQEGLGVRRRNLPDVSPRFDGRAEPRREGRGIRRGAVEGQLDDARYSKARDQLGRRARAQNLAVIQ